MNNGTSLRTNVLKPLNPYQKSNTEISPFFRELDGFAGLEPTIGGTGGFFTNINIVQGGKTDSDSLIGGSGTDTFNITGTKTANNIDEIVGGAETDAIVGLDAAANWTLGDTNWYISTNTLNFASFETLVGGSEDDTFSISGARSANLLGQGGEDTFLFADAATLTGAIDGGASSDLLDFTSYTAD